MKRTPQVCGALSQALLSLSEAVADLISSNSQQLKVTNQLVFVPSPYPSYPF